jgi:uncharacterized protein (UPF0332 family)
MKDKMEWCLKLGETGRRKHKGLRKIDPDIGQSKEYLKKAEHNIQFAEYVSKSGKFDDWIFPAAFYAMYHACLAILSYFGYESRNQECTFTALEYLNAEKKIDISNEDLDILRRVRKSAGEEADVKTLREDFQYGSKTKADKELVQNTINLAINFVKKVKGLLYVKYGEI